YPVFKNQYPNIIVSKGYKNGTSPPIKTSLIAKEAPIPKMIGFKVPCISVSPIPAIGPIKPVLNPVITSPSIGAPLDFSSSFDKVAPTIIDPNIPSEV